MQLLKKPIQEILKAAFEYYEEAIDGIFDGKKFENFDIQKAKNAVQWCYEKCGYKAPLIIVVENPLEKILLLNCLEIDPLADDYGAPLSKIGRQIYSGIDNAIEYCRYESDDFYSQLSSAISDKLRRRINSPLYQVLFEAESHDRIVEAFGNGNLGKVPSQVLKFLDTQPGNHILTRCKSNFHFKRKAEMRIPLLEVLSAFSIYYLTFFKFMVEELDLPSSDKIDFNFFYELQRESGIFSCCCFEQVAIISKYPKKIFQKENGSWDLHNPLGRAVEWGYSFAKFDCHYINGTYVDTDIFERVNNCGLSFDAFMRIKSEEKKAAVISLIKENFSDDELLTFLNACLIDEREVQHANGYIEIIKLYQTKECYGFLQNRFGEMNQPFAWIEFTCPSTQKTYLISTCPEFKNATDAAKWHRPEFIPEKVPYIWSSAS